jgi:hypothetical protein
LVVGGVVGKRNFGMGGTDGIGGGVKALHCKIEKE